MKRRILVSVLTVVMVLTSAAVCFAGSMVQPRYVATSTAKTDLIVSGANAIACVKVKGMDKSSLDSVVMSVSVINSNTKKAVKTWNQTLSMDSTSTFYFENSVTLTTKGSYYTKVVAKCYKGGKLIETISQESKTRTY